MPGKETGLGDHLWVGKFDLSGDVGAVTKITGGPAELLVTGLDKSAPERIGGVSDAEIDFNCFFNPDALHSHVALKDLPTTDVLVSYFHGAVVGNAAASMMAKQCDYNWTRGANGSLEGTVKTLSGITGLGLEWGVQLTAGKVTHASAANVASVDGAAASANGCSAYVHVFSLSSGTVVPIIQDSADDTSFAAITNMTFTGVTSGSLGGYRKQTVSPTQAVRRYVRFASTGTFTNAAVAVQFLRYLWVPTL